MIGVSTFFVHAGLVSELDAAKAVVQGFKGGQGIIGRPEELHVPVGNALVADLLPRESLAKGLSLFGATMWLGGVLGFAVAGYAMKSLGMVTTIFIGVCLTLAAMAVLAPVRAVARAPGAGAAAPPARVS